MWDVGCRIGGGGGSRGWGWRGWASFGSCAVNRWRYNLQIPHIVLASASPRRKELLAGLVSDFEVVVSHVDESFERGAAPATIAERIALDKARTVLDLRREASVIGADTIVAYEDAGGQWELLGKPFDHADAVRMLLALSGRSHVVVTGVAVVSRTGEQLFSDTTTVFFRRLDREEIERYVATGEPMDKAGAYAIQGGAKSFVERIEGSWSNVVGLPLEALAVVLNRIPK